MALTDIQKKAVVMQWALENDLVLCSKDALHRLVQIINDVGLGVSARVDDNGQVYFNVNKLFDYTEMMGLKGIIESDIKYHQNKEEGPENEGSKD